MRVAVRETLARRGFASRVGCLFVYSKDIRAGGKRDVICGRIIGSWSSLYPPDSSFVFVSHAHSKGPGAVPTTPEDESAAAAGMFEEMGRRWGGDGGRD